MTREAIIEVRDLSNRFGSQVVPATLVEDRVLMCEAPAAPAGDAGIAVVAGAARPHGGCA